MPAEHRRLVQLCDPGRRLRLLSSWPGPWRGPSNRRHRRGVCCRLRWQFWPCRPSPSRTRRKSSASDGPTAPTLARLSHYLRRPSSELFFVDRPGDNRVHGRLDLVYDPWLYPVFESIGLAEPRSAWLARALETGPVQRRRVTIAEPGSTASRRRSRSSATAA